MSGDYKHSLYTLHFSYANNAAPSAPQSCASSQIYNFASSFSSSALIIPGFFATPPVIIYSPGFFFPRRAASAPTFEATDTFRPWMISATALFCATKDTTSDSATIVTW